MNKNELIMLLRDADVRKKIIEVVRLGAKIPASNFTGQPSLKADLLFLLADEDIRKELLNILRSPEKISAPTTSAPKVSVQTTTQPKISVPNVQPPKPAAQPQKSVMANGADMDIKSLREKIRNRITQRAAAPPPTVEVKQEEITDTNFTYIAEKVCPICEEKTRIVQCKARLVADTRDVDFCMHYKDFNPYLYTIWVCEKCGYAAEDNRFLDRYADRVRKSLREFLSQNNFRTPFVEIRDVETALTFYETALYFNEEFEPSAGRQAGLYQKMAWVCRIAGDTVKEKEYLLKCAELYEISIDKERYPIGKVSDNFAMYTIGANYFLLKDFEKAAKYLNMIIGNSNLRSTAPKLYEKARDIWQDIRSMRK
ncbi:MAG: DUF2225 domain-containing protein [Selenomonadaceae bacterium]|nr:DUF2225 domain-containing protein [Selenomonadaceae bacterium]